LVFLYPYLSCAAFSKTGFTAFPIQFCTGIFYVRDESEVLPDHNLSISVSKVSKQRINGDLQKKKWHKQCKAADWQKSYLIFIPVVGQKSSTNKHSNKSAPTLALKKIERKNQTQTTLCLLTFS